ncbi:hypothetical protein GCK72_004568 [Caenorhabditis remanei]|uniref:Uncharacterized protein n=1 Tax=Caenorhabditis remanei TaxID=31234 RepID=A0A6A5HC66_CAERE|nr:hypothetical protein GCK72_004568 [Caenorhabditis remanei]KAF1764619.1 hypothetical protein GCK72_004568 [Caenorhabditis remanei]
MNIAFPAECFERHCKGSIEEEKYRSIGGERGGAMAQLHSFIMAPVPVDLSKIDFRQLLRKNVPGSGHFMGMRYQRGGNMRGGGLGGILGAVASFLPTFMNSFAGKQLISAGKDLATELSQGQDLKSSLKSVAQKKMRQLSGNGRRPRKNYIKGRSVTVLKPHFVSQTPRDNFL